MPRSRLKKGCPCVDSGFAAANKTLTNQDITFGMVSASGDYTPLVSFNSLPPGKTVKVMEPVMVKVYIGAGLQSGTVDYWISSSTAIWEASLDTLADEVTLDYSADEKSAPILRRRETRLTTASLSVPSVPAITESIAISPVSKLEAI
ncbi:hypothetical protein DACRYDRAFT_104101 [Dacryopinax primogenitus]|uniref:Uncharacterized protein n=1 Tax=Dacryopinax primogenitus (strain DJM 731) TaxID=1858805 RepID=M5GER0_DACPD|nr:uncharacterized protein DACRYDRAFT_104101 [Dacryopinax primogenitus]EJU05617.1 hypothetical protein DACRYDRAFT_104101 [Dacryopinax primogenitus]